MSIDIIIADLTFCVTESRLLPIEQQADCLREQCRKTRDELEAIADQLSACRSPEEARASAVVAEICAMDAIVEAYNTWPADLRKKLSLHDLRRMTGWTPKTNVGDWRIDLSTDNPILVYQNCSVIQDEQARYVLKLIQDDAALKSMWQDGVNAAHPAKAVPEGETRLKDFLTGYMQGAFDHGAKQIDDEGNHITDIATGAAIHAGYDNGGTQ